MYVYTVEYMHDCKCAVPLLVANDRECVAHTHTHSIGVDHIVKYTYFFIIFVCVCVRSLFVPKVNKSNSSDRQKNL